MGIIYKKGDLFTEPDLHKKIIVHSCNGKGVWGRGFALTCKEKFPRLYEEYKNMIEFKDLLSRYGRDDKHHGGSAFLIYDGQQFMRCLITSHEYVKDKLDSKEKILENTRKGLEYILETHLTGNVYISPKFNSGLFGVPWEETEAILKEILEGTEIEWIVYSND